MAAGSEAILLLSLVQGPSPPYLPLLCHYPSHKQIHNHPPYSLGLVPSNLTGTFHTGNGILHSPTSALRSAKVGWQIDRLAALLPVPCHPYPYRMLRRSWVLPSTEVGMGAENDSGEGCTI
jgi:hypothetical protein